MVNDLGQCRVYVLLLQCCGVSESMKPMVGHISHYLKKKYMSKNMSKNMCNVV